MKDLTKQEMELKGAFSLGMGLNQGRAVLQSREISFHEETEQNASGNVVVGTGGSTAQVRRR